MLHEVKQPGDEAVTSRHPRYYTFMMLGRINGYALAITPS